MSLAPGTRLGPYEVVALLGAGGRGEVYRARDTRLNRDVALKILPDLFARDPDPGTSSGSSRARLRDERLARFEREAQVLASLNHPNIGHIYGLEDGSGTRALVLELIPGPTLADRLAAGAIPIDEALSIARQIADALEAAHEHGIIHRDLKPANIKVKDDGTVKVLDFGLAKALDPGASSSPEVANSPTLTAHATEMGMILGTAAYMAPEQARGKAVDRRADIWAFGIVLWEMLTGRRMFDAEGISDTLAAVLRQDIDWNALPGSTPLSIRRLLERCLERDPKRRLRDIGEARIAIEDVLSGSAAAPMSAFPVASAKPLWRRVVPVVLAAAVAILAGLGGWRFRTPATAPAPVMRFDVTLPDGDSFESTTDAVLVSPDGRYLVYAANRNGKQQLFLRMMGDAEARPIPGTVDALLPFLSPDGAWVGFSAAGKLQKTAVAGGSPIVVCDLGGNSAFSSWGPDDTIVISTPSGLMRVSATGGTPQPLTKLQRDRREQSHRWPLILPGGRAVLFGTVSTDTTTFDEARIEALSLDTGERKALVEGGRDPRYVSTGHILFARSGDIYAVPFDAAHLAISGEPVRVLTGVSSSAGQSQFGVSETGSLVFISGPSGVVEGTLVLVDRHGVAESIGAPRRRYGTVRVSPDGRRVVAETLDAVHTVWVYDIERRTLNRVSSGTGRHGPSWMPDGRYVSFSGDRLFVRQAVDGSATEEVLIDTDTDVLTGAGAGSWSPNGKLFAFWRRAADTHSDIWGFAPDDQQKVKPIIRTQFEEYSPAISPDGRWLAYVSDASGRDEVYVQPVSGSGRKWQVSLEGGTGPAWARSGREIFYRRKNEMFGAVVTNRIVFSASRPERLFESSFTTGSEYDVMPDGQRFLMIRESDSSTPQNQIHIVLNWFQELKRLAPAGRD